jgi:NAD(P)-dependent dehydrogenase (short-subunit alcohol dehydrogenase family)
MLQDRVTIITGGGRGIGREHALLFASLGAKVVVNDLGGAIDGSGSDVSAAQSVVDEIVAAGGHAVASTDSVTSFDGAKAIVDLALATFGDLHVVVNNAGILRDRMLVSLDEDDWDQVIRVHLKGTFAPARWAAAYWREQSKAGSEIDARIITTTSAAGLYGTPGQTNYSAAKAGIVGFTLSASLELARYGVTVNAVAPAGRTRMTEQVFTGNLAEPADGFDFLDAQNVAPIVVWLGSAESRGITGRVFEVAGGRVTIAEGFARGPSGGEKRRLDPGTVGPLVLGLLKSAAPITSAHG